MSSAPLAKVRRIVDMLWMEEPDMTMQQAAILLAVARQDGMTLAEIGEDTGATTQAVWHACQTLATPAPVALPSRRWWRRPKPEGQRLSLLEIRASAAGDGSSRRAFITPKGRKLVGILENILEDGGARKA